MITWPTIITLIVAIIGAVLGVMNTWHSMSQRRLRLRVKPAHAFGIGVGPKAPTFGIEVINQSAFAVTIVEVGFIFGKGRGKLPARGAIVPYMIDGGSWPRRLEPREAVSLYCYPESLPRDGRSIGKAYAKTACAEIVRGDSPALAQLRRTLS